MKTKKQWADEWFARDWSTPSNARAHIEDDIAAVQKDALENPPLPPMAKAPTSADQWQALALAALCICYYRPHPREWWDGEMKPESEQIYNDAMAEVSKLKGELGLTNIPAQ